MDISELRDLSDEQLREEVENARREVFNLRFRAVTRQLANTQEVGRARRNVARLLTVLRERELASKAAMEGGE